MKNSNAGCLAALFLWMLGNRMQKAAEEAQKPEQPETGLTKPWSIPPETRPNYKDDGFDEGDVRHHYDY